MRGSSEEAHDHYSQSDDLKNRVLDPEQDGHLRLKALRELGGARTPDGLIPDDAFSAVFEILWNYLDDRHSDFPGEGEELKSIFRDWKERLVPRQLGFVLGIHRCLRKGSFVVFWACLKGNADQRSERLIEEAKWCDFKPVIEEYEARWHAQPRDE